jgi:uncharacterized membrane protein
MTLDRLGNLHLVFLHLPIGFVVAAVLLELGRWRRPSVEGDWLQNRLLAANAVAALITAGAGLLLASRGTYASDTLMLHRWSGVVCAALAIIAWRVHAADRKRTARVLLAGLLAVTIYTGHQGATLTHGPDFVAFWKKETPAPATPVVAQSTKPTDDRFATEIRTLLERRCLDCHGVKKARGRLRLDSREDALKAGKSGTPAIMPGHPETSELMRRVRLPRDDDEAMPADDGPGLTPAEISALEQWIAGGAVWP